MKQLKGLLYKGPYSMKAYNILSQNGLIKINSILKINEALHAIIIF